MIYLQYGHQLKHDLVSKRRRGEVIQSIIHSQKPSDGLGFAPQDIGFAMSVSAMPLICLQMYVFPFCEGIFGAKKVLQIIIFAQML